jgi:hypothetical protein
MTWEVDTVGRDIGVAACLQPAALMQAPACLPACTAQSTACAAGIPSQCLTDHGCARLAPMRMQMW